MSGFSLDHLFRVSKIREIGNAKIVVRALSDFEIQSRSLECVLASARMQQKLENPESPEHLSLLTPLPQQSIEVLTETLSRLRRRELESEARDKFQPRYIPFPDKASDEERREVSLKRESQAGEVKTQRESYVEETLASYQALIKDKAKEWLVQEVRSKTISAACDSAYSQAWAYETLWVCCNKEDGSQYFTKEDARSLDYRIANLLLEDFREVNDIDPLSLTPSSATE